MKSRFKNKNAIVEPSSNLWLLKFVPAIFLHAFNRIVFLSSIPVFISCVGGGIKESDSVEVVPPTPLENEERCSFGEPILLSCEYQLSGTNRVVIRLEGKAMSYFEPSIRDSSLQLVLDNNFPNKKYSIGGIRKDLTYQQLEKSGYCAFTGQSKSLASADKAPIAKSRQNLVSVFVPAAITSGLLEEGTFFIRRWKLKKSKNKDQNITDEIVPLSDRKVSSFDELIAKCVVQARGSDELVPQNDDGAASDSSAPGEIKDPPSPHEDLKSEH